MNKTVTLILRGVLLVASLALIYALVQSILEPIRFNKVKQERYTQVINKLKDIRIAQRAYKSEYGRYTGSFDTLVDFLKNGQLTVELQIGSLDDSVAVAKGLVKRIKQKINVRDSLLKNVNYDSLAYVPAAKPGTKFEMASGILLTSSKVEVPVFEAKVHNDLILYDLERQQVVNLNDERKKLDKYPGLKVGDLNMATNDSGNWE
ncbi:MAG: hypothetical protein LBK47_09840 [Prevotellaceae bacterium]|jgi:hypothetical protein|nr:hypothetical protein [Prevotellaceae bacterium]